MLTSNRKTDRGKRSAFTVLEVIVVIFVIGLLLALLLPAVQSSRSAAQQIACLNRLRQIQIAASNHESNTGSFPTEFWHNQLREQMEIPENAKKVVSFTCPIDPEALGSGALFSFAINNGLGGSQQLRNGFARPGGKRNAVRARDVTDGLSNSVMFAEKLSYPSIAGQQTIAWEELPNLNDRAYRIVEVEGDSADAIRGAAIEQPVFYERAWVFDFIYTHLMGPNEPSVVNVGVSKIVRGRAAASLHGGGTHVGLADASARFVSDEIDIEVWRAIGTINEREVHGEF